MLSGYELYTDAAVAVLWDFAYDVCEKVLSKNYTFVVLFGTVWCSVHLPCHGDHGSCSTHRKSNESGLFQLDYMLVSEHLQGEACVVQGSYHLSSDHWLIDASLGLERKELWGTVIHDEFSQRGWAPKN